MARNKTRIKQGKEKRFKIARYQTIIWYTGQPMICKYCNNFRRFGRYHSLVHQIDKISSILHYIFFQNISLTVILQKDRGLKQKSAAQILVSSKGFGCSEIYANSESLSYRR